MEGAEFMGTRAGHGTVVYSRGVPGWQVFFEARELRLSANVIPFQFALHEVELLKQVKQESAIA